MSRIESENCVLRLIGTGEPEPCAREGCAFWEPGGAVVEGRCSIECLGVDVRRRDLAAYLLEKRMCLEQARDLAEAEGAYREFSRRIGGDL